MKQEINAIQVKTYEFSLQIIELSRFLSRECKEFVIAQQILKSGTSIGANVEEALGGQSTKDFQSKMSIAYKEARETDYWLRLLKDSKIITTEQYNKHSLILVEILKILGSIQKTLRTKNK